MTPALAAARVVIDRIPARELARRELDKPIYHAHDPNPVMAALNAVVGWLVDWAGRAADHVPGRWPGLVALAALVVALIVAVRLRAGPLRREAGRAVVPAGEEPRTAEQFRAAARRHAEAGEWPAAVADRMRALATELEDRGVVGRLPGRTADELAAEAGAALPARAAGLRDAARRFDALWYGGRPGGAADYRAVAAVDDAIRGVRAPA